MESPIIEIPTTSDATLDEYPEMVHRALEAAEAMYPDGEIRVRRGRVIIVDGDLIRLISYSAGKTFRRANRR